METFDLHLRVSTTARPFHPQRLPAGMKGTLELREISVFFHVRQKAEFLRLPSQCLARASTGGGIVERDEVRHPVEMCAPLVLSEAPDREAEPCANRFRNRAHGHALFGDSMISASRGSFLNHEPVELSSIEPVHRGPAVEAVAHIRRNALLARNA